MYIIYFVPQMMSLSCTARQRVTVGEMTNLMSVDVQKLQDAAQWIHHLWIVPVVIGLGVYFLYQILGVAAFGGLFVLLLMPAMAFIVGGTMQHFQVE